MLIMIKFNYARDALKFLIKKYNIKQIYIPYYLCNVIRHAIFEANCKPLFYHINDDFMPAVKLPADSFILYPNYFGVCSKNINKLVKIYPKLIIDNAHALYAKPSGFASFNSERKFQKVKFGAYLYFGEELREIQPDKSRREIFNQYYNQYQTSNLLKLDIPEDAIPFCYPYLAKSEKDADTLVKRLTKQGLIIYRYWNPLPPTFNEYKFYSRLVPIPLT